MPAKEEFYSNLSMEDVTDSCMQKEFESKDFKVNNLDEYHVLYLKNDTLRSVDVFKHFTEIYLKIYNLDTIKTISVPGFAFQSGLKKTQVKLELLIDIDMLLMIEKDIREGIYHAIHQYLKTNNKYMKDYDKNKE